MKPKWSKFIHQWYDLTLLLIWLATQEVIDDVDGHWEDDGGVVLSCDAVKRLQIA